MKSLAELRKTVAGPGRVVWIGLRPARRAPVMDRECVDAMQDLGLEGDHHPLQPGGPRQVTLIQQEHLPVIASLCRLPSVDPALLRRNLLVAGINLLALKEARFVVGEAVLEGSGLCHPCSRMEEALGSGGYTAVRGHGGITARVVRSGRICRGDLVRLLDA